MLDLEDQIRRLADHSFARTEPVRVERRGASSQRNQRRYWAVAAAVIALLGAAAAIANLRTDEDANVATNDGALVISDPLRLDLDELVAASPAQRIDAMEPLVTFDLDVLPEEWTADQAFAITVPGSDGAGYSYWQQIAVRAPGGERLVMNVTGALDGSVLSADSLVDGGGGEPIEVRGQPGRRNASGIDWIEQGRARVMLLNGPIVGAVVDHELMLSFAELLEPVEAMLDWSGEEEFPVVTGDAPATVEPLVAGTLADVAWRIVQIGTDLQLQAGPDHRVRGGTAHTEPFDPLLVEYSIEPVAVPGGLIVYGHGPDNIALVRLRLDDGLAELPVVRFGDQRVAFAVPISDHLDPTSIEFDDGNGRVLASISLADLPPYLGGSIESGVRVSE